MRTIFYARVSTAEQTLSHQQTQAEKAGYVFDMVIADHGVSGVSVSYDSRQLEEVVNLVGKGSGIAEVARTVGVRRVIRVSETKRLLAARWSRPLGWLDVESESALGRPTKRTIVPPSRCVGRQYAGHLGE